MYACKKLNVMRNTTITCTASSSSCPLVSNCWGKIQPSSMSLDLASHRVNLVHTVMLCVHFFRGLPLYDTPSTEPSNTFFTHHQSSGMRQIWSKNSSFLCRIMSITVFFLCTLSLMLSSVFLSCQPTPSMFL